MKQEKILKGRRKSRIIRRRRSIRRMSRTIT